MLVIAVASLDTSHKDSTNLTNLFFLIRVAPYKNNLGLILSNAFTINFVQDF